MTWNTCLLPRATYVSSSSFFFFVRLLCSSSYPFILLVFRSSSWRRLVETRISGSRDLCVLVVFLPCSFCHCLYLFLSVSPYTSLCLSDSVSLKNLSAFLYVFLYVVYSIFSVLLYFPLSLCPTLCHSNLSFFLTVFFSTCRANFLAHLFNSSHFPYLYHATLTFSPSFSIFPLIHSSFDPFLSPSFSLFSVRFLHISFLN